MVPGEETRRTTGDDPDLTSGSAHLDHVVPSRVLEFNLRCLTCGYNLRGLAGDPVRCPECGQLNPLGEAEIPEALITARLRRWEASLVVCVGALLFALPWQFLLCALLVEAMNGTLGPNAVGEVLSCPGIPAFGPLIVWVAAVFSFRASCRSKPGWGRALVRYHLYGLGVGGPMLAVMLIIPVVLSPIGRGMQTSNYLVPAVVFGGAIIGVRKLLRGPHRRLMTDIHALQRDSAIATLRDEARDRSGAAMSWGRLKPPCAG
jgi:hypothetical protein